MPGTVAVPLGFGGVMASNMLQGRYDRIVQERYVEELEEEVGGYRVEIY